MNFKFTSDAWDEYLEWQSKDKSIIKRINILLRDIARGGYEGIGKPEALKDNLSGYWSRRINDEHRLVYRICAGDTCEIVQCRGHYDE